MQSHIQYFVPFSQRWSFGGLPTGCSLAVEDEAIAAADRSVRSVLCGGYKAVMLVTEGHAFERARARVEGRGEYLGDLAELVEARKLIVPDANTKDAPKTP